MIHQYLSSPDINNVFIGFHMMMHASPEECWYELLKAVDICSREENHVINYSCVHVETVFDDRHITFRMYKHQSTVNDISFGKCLSISFRHTTRGLIEVEEGSCRRTNPSIGWWSSVRYKSIFKAFIPRITFEEKTIIHSKILEYVNYDTERPD